MKQLGFFLTLIINLSLFSQSDTFITNQKVGNIELNMPFPETLPIGFTWETVQRITFYEGQRFVNYITHVKKEDKLVLACIVEENRVQEIEIFDVFKTKEGIGVGSSLKEFTTVYPDYKIVYSNINNLIIIESNMTAGQFVIDKKFLIHKTLQYLEKQSVSQQINQIELKLVDFKLDTKIKSILII